MPCCSSQKDKAQDVHNHIFTSYTKAGIFGEGAIAVSFLFEETDKDFTALEVFRNIDAAEAYYDHFMADKYFVCRVLANLPWRQKQGPTAAVGDGNVKAWITIPEGGTLESVLTIGKQTQAYNKLAWSGSRSGKVPIEEWKNAPTAEELEAQFRKFHFGWRGKPSMAGTDTAPASAEIER